MRFECFVLKKRPHLTGLEDLYSVYVQSLAQPETITPSTVVFYLRRWHPSRFALTQRVEVALDGKSTVTSLKEVIARTHLGVKAEHVDETAKAIRVVAPSVFELKDVVNMDALPWHEPKLRASSTLAGAPWRLRHGDTVVFKTLGEVPEAALDDTAGAEVATQANMFNLMAVGAARAAVEGVGRRDGGVARILTPAEQRAKKQKALEEAERMEAERVDLERALQARLDEAAAAAAES